MTASAANLSATMGSHTRDGPSHLRRLSTALSFLEQGEAELAPAGAQNQIDEEIEEIKRYEVSRAIFGSLVIS